MGQDRKRRIKRQRRIARLKRLKLKARGLKASKSVA